MSKTPRTDEIVKLKWDGHEYVSVKFAHKLEIEIAQYKKALEESQKREAMSLACIESWKQDEGADAKRMEWLLDQELSIEVGHLEFGDREEIDEAMKEEQS